MKINYALQETYDTIFFENSHVKIVINKSGGEVVSLFNKADGSEALEKSDRPWFTYLTVTKDYALDLGKIDLINYDIIKPTTLELEGDEVSVTYENSLTLIFEIRVKRNYFSVTLKSEPPKTVDGIILCNLTTNADWDLDNPDTFALSAVPMTTTVNIHCRPGGEAKKAFGVTHTYLDAKIKGSKLGVAFSKITDHRQHLKDIVDDIDPKRGITSTHGGPYALDCKDLTYDYVIATANLSPENAVETAQMMNKYSVEQYDMHQGRTFNQGDFNFVCANKHADFNNGVYCSAKEFKKNIADKMRAEGVQLSLHTYGSLVCAVGKFSMNDPWVLNQIVTSPETWSLSCDVDESETDFYTENDASGIILTECKNFPYADVHTNYLLIDNEIIRVEKSDKRGFLNVRRGACDTNVAPHYKGAEIKQLCGWYGMFQPVPLSNLFYDVARRTAKVYNDGGFEMLYIDALESFFRKGLCDLRQGYYIYSEFIRELISNCKVPPIIEYSCFYPNLWAGRGRGGAIDYVFSGYKAYKNYHLARQREFHKCFYTATVGWFDYCPDMNEKYKDTIRRAMHRDDLDHMGSQALKDNFGTECTSFTVDCFASKTRLRHNFYYYSAYSRLRKGDYFSPEVKKLIEPDKEYKLLRVENNEWVLREMHYDKHKIFDISEPSFVNAKAVNPYQAQTPFIRIEQRYTAKAENVTPLFIFDENKPVREVQGVHEFEPTSVVNTRAFKIKIHGNGSESDAVLLSLRDKLPNRWRLDLFVPVNFEGWREIILIEANNDDYEGFDFPSFNDPYGNRTCLDLNSINSVTVSLCGECKGVMLGEFSTCQITDAPVEKPSISIGDKKITFNAELHGGDYIEYYPNENKAYLSFYGKNLDGNSTTFTEVATNGEMIVTSDDEAKEAHVREIGFEGTIEAPAGKFDYTYSAKALSALTTRAQVVFGFGGKILKNPDSWIAPNVDMPEDIEKVALY